jgi:hypothetical protein
MAGPADKTTSAVTLPRCRISAWTDPAVFRTANGKFDPTALKAEVFSGQPGGYRVLDDISLLLSIIDDNTAALKVGWDTRTLPGDPKNVSTYVQQIIDHCHDVLGVQCLIGWERKDARGSKFEAWARMATPTPSVDDFTDRIVDFCEKNLKNYDGISFDIEGLTPTPDTNPAKLKANTELMKQNLSAFYRTLARKLASPGAPLPTMEGKSFDAGYDRMVAFAAAPLIGPQKEANGTEDGKIKKSRFIEHETDGRPKRDGGRFVTRSGTLQTAEPSFLIHDWEVGGANNIIVRPMCYDIDPAFTTDRLYDWHWDIVEYAVRLSKAGKMPVGCFQLGLRTNANNPGRAGQVSDAEIARRCQNFLAPSGVGVCFFPTSRSHWRQTNDALNSGLREAGRTLGQPVQQPLNDFSWQVLNQTPKPMPPSP